MSIFPSQLINNFHVTFIQISAGSFQENNSKIYMETLRTILCQGRKGDTNIKNGIFGLSGRRRGVDLWKEKRARAHIHYHMWKDCQCEFYVWGTKLVLCDNLEWGEGSGRGSEESFICCLADSYWWMAKPSQ